MNSRLVLSRRVGESIVVHGDKILTVDKIGNRLIVLRYDGTTHALATNYPPIDLGGGMLVDLADVGRSQIKLRFIGPKAVSVVRSELLDPA